MIEIERKFLVRNMDFINSAKVLYEIKQAYLSSVPERTVRVRTKGAMGYITIKGKSSEDGTSRYEWEKEIPVEEAIELMKLAEPLTIEKTRYIVPFNGSVYEVDVFENHHKGLIIAEIELNSPNEIFNKPNWLGKEVTGKKEYYNAFLKNKPFVNV